MANVEELTQALKHMAGQHDQHRHAPGDRSPADLRDAEKLESLQKQRYRTWGQDREIERLKVRLALDPKKWRVGHGVGMRVSSGRGTQISRGFRIVSVDPDEKMVVIRQVADTGLTVSGGDYDRMPDIKADMVDLVRDRRYDARE